MPVSASVRERHDPGTGGMIGAALGAALLFASLKLPPLNLFLAPVSPFPLLVQRLKGGAGGAWLSGLLAAALVAVGLSPALALGFLLLLVAPGLLLAEAVARGRGLRRGCAWAFALLAGEVAVGLLLAGRRMVDFLFQRRFEELRSPAFLDGMRESGLPPEQVESWLEALHRAEAVMQVVYPAAFVILAALLVLANAWLLRTYLMKRDPAWLDGGEFESIRWPLGLAVAFVLAGAAVTFPAARPAAYNVLLLLAFFFALQGLAVVVYYTRRLAAPVFLRAAVLLLVLVNPWAMQILPLLGLFDIWFDFRKWAEPPASPV